MTLFMLWSMLVPMQDAADPAVVSHVKVVSDKVADVSSLEAWKRATLREGMSAEEKALAVWRSVASHQHQDAPPLEFLTHEDTVCDAIKVFNVYGYGFCSMASAEVASLARYAGLEARGWGINSHSVSEVGWDGAWHLLDASLINYFKRPDGRIASVEDLIAATNAWYDRNPGFKGDHEKLVAFHREGGWQGWKRGPELLSSSPTMDKTGWWPARTHGWYATMQEYDGRGGGAGNKAFLYEYGYSQGYQVNNQLRLGERLTRHWSNQGLHVNMKQGGGPGCLKMQTGRESLVYTPAYGDLAPGRVGNGVHEYVMPLKGGAWRRAALSVENLEAAQPVVADPSRPGVLVVRFPSSYVYLGGVLSISATGNATISFSDNHGLEWKEIGKGSGDLKVDLSPHVLRRYDYRLRIELQGKGAALKALGVVHDVQHSQRPLPALAKGPNTVSFSSGPAEGTITLEGSVHEAHRGKNLVYSDFRPRMEGFERNLFVGGSGRGTLTFPVSAPGDLVRLRFGTHYRARDARDGIDYEVSFDGGGTWKAAGRAAGPVAGHCLYVAVPAPPGVREALVRFNATSRNATGILGFRIDADYREPFGGFRPVKATYRWEEDGRAKERIFVAKRPEETWSIRCDAAPVMKSISLELAE
jgi:hypothetical protein